MTPPRVRSTPHVARVPSERIHSESFGPAALDPLDGERDLAATREALARIEATDLVV